MEPQSKPQRTLTMVTPLRCCIVLFLTYVNSHFSNACDRPRDCADILSKKRDAKSGVYTIYPEQLNVPKRVYCDMETSCGGWTVIQKRVDGSLDFYRNWTDYKHGFGRPSGEYWIGNDVIHSISQLGQTELRVELEDFEHSSRFAVYSNFSVADENSAYRLTVGGYYGNAGDSLVQHNQRDFNTPDSYPSNIYNCAEEYKSGWWFWSCHTANLNGLYHQGGHHTDYGLGINWYPWRGHHYSYKTAVMMIRRQIPDTTN